MIKDRRDLVEALGSDNKGVHTDRLRESFISVQHTVEAIDRAIAHEQLIAREREGSPVAPIMFGPAGPVRFE